MIKKLFSFLCCLLPVGAVADVINPDTNGMVSADTWDITDGGIINASNAIGIESGLGFTVNNMLVGVPSSQGILANDLYVLNSVNADVFTVLTGGNVSIDALLAVLNQKQLVIRGKSSGAGVFDLSLGSVDVGNDTQAAGLKIESVNDFDVDGVIDIYGDFEVSANDINVGVVDVFAGKLDMQSAGDMALDTIVVGSANTVSLSADGNISLIGDVQNNAVEQFVVQTAGNLSVGGALENKSDGGMIVDAGDFAVGQTFVNDTNADLVLNVKSWTVNGTSDVSVVNKGNLYATVENDTVFANGINLTGMGLTNEFSLDTGTLDVGTGVWFDLFSNKLQNFSLTVRKGNLDVGSILNGAASNVSAQMDLLAQNISAESIVNNASSLVIKAADLASGYDVVNSAASTEVGNISVAGTVETVLNSDTQIISSGVINIAGAISNAGDLFLNAPQIILASISNVGTELNSAELNVKSLLDKSGKIVVGGDIVNTYADMILEAKEISITGLIEINSGSFSLKASDNSGGAVQLLGAVNVADGVADFNALAGDITVGGALTVSNGNLNLGTSLFNLTVNDDVEISGNLLTQGQGNGGSGNLAISAMGPQSFVLKADSISVGKNVIVGDDENVRNVTFDAADIDVAENLIVNGDGSLIAGVGNTLNFDVDGQVQVKNGATLTLASENIELGALMVDGLLRVNQATGITVDAGNVDIVGNLYFTEEATADAGLVFDVNNVDEFILKTTLDNSLLSVDAVDVAVGKTLGLDSAGTLLVDGAIYNAGSLTLSAAGSVVITDVITNLSDLTITGNSLNLAGINNVSDTDVVITANGECAITGNINNLGSSLRISATDSIVAGSVVNIDGGLLTMTADTINMQAVVLEDPVGTQLNLNAESINAFGNVRVAGDFVQDGNMAGLGMLNHNATDFTMAGLYVDGDFIVSSGNTTYNVAGSVELGGDIVVAKGAFVDVTAGSAIGALSTNIINSGSLTLHAKSGMAFDAVVNNSGELILDSGAGLLALDSLNINSGNVVFAGSKAYLYDAIDTGAMLYQNWGTALSAKDINIDSDNYFLMVEGLNLKGINQEGNLVVYTSDIDIGNAGINASSLSFIAQKDGDNTIWQNVNVNGNVSGNVDFIGLEKMQIQGNYTFNNGSSVNAAILPYADGLELNTTDVNYWASVSLNNDNTLGVITNPTGEGAGALISVAGKFETDLTLVGGVEGSGLANAQFGVDIFDVVDAGTAIWLLHADAGITDLATKIRNLNVRFCNADGTLCYNYFDSLTKEGSNDSDDLPIYIAERDTDGDFKIDSLYIVFDPRFGGPVEVFKTQDVVVLQDDYSLNEYLSAGAIDNMIAGQLAAKRFNHRTTIELIPIVFKGTNLSKVATELYNRMEFYAAVRDGALFVPFSRLFQVRELEQIAGSVALNEHTSFRSFEDRMLDEFIWNRGRKLKKAWLDMDYGMYFQNVADGKHADGNRFSMSGGFDFQATNTLMLGLIGRISHNSSDLSDKMDLSYADVKEAGHVDLSVADTNIGLGAYLMETVSEKARIYGNAFLDIHVFDVERSQNFVAPIEGAGSAFALTSEWGLMHDILNQYIVGNVYARMGYNFGFSVTEQAAGADYMNLKSDGYFIFTPGYTLTAQKRIYPSAWFQIRPYLTLGVEYDVLGMPDSAKYKFAVADSYTYYGVEINPFWANVGAGAEFVVANGIQVGIDYRYQYNSAIQLHNIKISGSYRF